MDADVIRRHLLEIFQAAVESVNGRKVVRETLVSEQSSDPVAVIAIGKAAVDMALGVQDVLADQIQRGLVITKQGYADDGPRLHSVFTVMESEHPVPGPNSLLAGDALLDFCYALGDISKVIVCISGGTSSLVEVLPAGLMLQDIQELTESLLASGLDINRINAIRRKLSEIKGGRLAARLKGRDVFAYYISDVPDDDITVIGSGLLAAKREPASALGNDLFQLPHMPIQLPADSPVFENIHHRIVANLDQAKQAAAKAAKESGYEVHLHDTFLDQNVEAVAKKISDSLKTAPPGLHIWGGETVVELPENPGRGGRNQQLALLMAKEIKGSKDLTVLVAGTDGTDGVTDDAGALVDGATIERGETEGRNADEDLQEANSNAFLEASGDLVTTGPTGTNVMDLLIAYKLN